MCPNCTNYEFYQQATPSRLADGLDSTMDGTYSSSPRKIKQESDDEESDRKALVQMTIEPGSSDDYLRSAHGNLLRGLSERDANASKGKNKENRPDGSLAESRAEAGDDLLSRIAKVTVELNNLRAEADLMALPLGQHGFAASVSTTKMSIATESPTRPPQLQHKRKFDPQLHAEQHQLAVSRQTPVMQAQTEAPQGQISQTQPHRQGAQVYQFQGSDRIEQPNKARANGQQSQASNAQAKVQQPPTTYQHLSGGYVDVDQATRRPETWGDRVGVIAHHRDSRGQGNPARQNGQQAPHSQQPFDWKQIQEGPAHQKSQQVQLSQQPFDWKQIQEGPARCTQPQKQASPDRQNAQKARVDQGKATGQPTVSAQLKAQHFHMAQMQPTGDGTAVVDPYTHALQMQQQQLHHLQQERMKVLDAQIQMQSDGAQIQAGQEQPAAGGQSPTGQQNAALQAYASQLQHHQQSQLHHQQAQTDVRMSVQDAPALYDPPNGEQAQAGQEQPNVAQTLAGQSQQQVSPEPRQSKEVICHIAAIAFTGPILLQCSKLRQSVMPVPIGIMELFRAQIKFTLESAGKQDFKGMVEGFKEFVDYTGSQLRGSKKFEDERVRKALRKCEELVQTVTEVERTI